MNNNYLNLSVMGILTIEAYILHPFLAFLVSFVLIGIFLGSYKDGKVRSGDELQEMYDNKSNNNVERCDMCGKVLTKDIEKEMGYCTHCDIESTSTAMLTE